MEALSAACKSVLLGIALAEGRITPQDAVIALRLEEDMQMQHWGLVEGGHDIDIADTNVRVASPVLFLRLLQLP